MCEFIYIYICICLYSTQYTMVSCTRSILFDIRMCIFLSRQHKNCNCKLIMWSGSRKQTHHLPKNWHHLKFSRNMKSSPKPSCIFFLCKGLHKNRVHQAAGLRQFSRAFERCDAQRGEGVFHLKIGGILHKCSSLCLEKMIESTIKYGVHRNFQTAF